MARDAAVFNDPENCNVTDLASLGDLKSRFSVIYADPPWDYYSGDNAQNGAPYPTMKLTNIKQLPIKRDVAGENAQLFLWVRGGGVSVVSANPRDARV